MSVISYYIIHILSTTHPSDIHLLHKYFIFISCSHSTCVAPGRHVSTSRRGTLYSVRAYSVYHTCGRSVLTGYEPWCIPRTRTRSYCSIVRIFRAWDKYKYTHVYHSCCTTGVRLSRIRYEVPGTRYSRYTIDELTAYSSILTGPEPLAVPPRACAVEPIVTT